MRMRLAAILATVVAALVLGAGQQARAATPVKITVNITDPGDRVINATVRVSRFGEFNDTNVTPLPEGRYASVSTKSQDPWKDVTPTDGVSTPGGTREIKADAAGKPLEPGVYKIKVSFRDANGNSFYGEKIVYVGPGTTPTVTISTDQLGPIYGAQLNADAAFARGAVDKKDKAEYDAARASGAARVKEDEQTLSEIETLSETFRKANGIPEFKDADAVRRAVKAAKNTKGLPVNEDRVKALELYEDLLRYREFMKTVVKEARKLYKSFPDWPAEKPKAKPKNQTMSYYAPEPAPKSDFGASANISIRGGLNFGGANVSAKGDLETTTGSGNLSGSNGLTNPFLGMQMTIMLHNFAIQTAAFGQLTPIFHFYAAQNLGGFGSVLAANIHPGAANDAYVRFRRGFQAGVALGFAMALNQAALCGFGSSEGCMDLTLWAGPLLATVATRVIADETGGFGNYNTFTRNDTLLGAMLGMQFSYLACATCQLPMYLTFGGQLNLAGRPGGAGGRTSPFSFDYDGRVGSYTEAMFWVGVAFQLDQVLRALTAPR